MSEKPKFLGIYIKVSISVPIRRIIEFARGENSRIEGLIKQDVIADTHKK